MASVTLSRALQASFSMLGLVCGLLSNFCFAVRNVVTPSSPGGGGGAAAVAAESDSLFLAINVIATGTATQLRRSNL